MLGGKAWGWGFEGRGYKVDGCVCEEEGEREQQGESG